MRTPLAFILATAALAAAAPAASAAITSAYVGVPERTLTVTSDDVGDTIVITCPAGALLVNGADPQTGLLPCTGSTSASIVKLIGNGGADTLDVSALDGTGAGTISLDGGDGDDDLRGVFIGSNGITVSLAGGPGADTLTVNGSDVADGGAGDDRIDGTPQAGGTLTGGAGTDTFAFDLAAAQPVAFTFTLLSFGMTVGAPGVPQTQTVQWTSIEAADLVLGEGGQTVDGSAFAGTVRVAAGGGADTLIGTPRADFLDGGAGNDFIDGGAGGDVYQAGSGLDLLHARDGVADTGDCGSDEDTLVGDAIDVLAGCERIELPAAPPPPPDTTQPVLGVKGATLRNRRLRVPVSCPATEVRCAGIATLIAVGRRAGGSVRVRLGAITFELAGGTTAKLSRRVSRSRLRALRKLKRVRLRVALDVVDASGNRAISVQRVRLRR
jgi:hypothetical protein